MKKEETSVIKGGKERPIRHNYLSAQEYERLTDEEKQRIRDDLLYDGHNPYEFERKMKALWPKEFKPKELKWRRK